MLTPHILSEFFDNTWLAGQSGLKVTNQQIGKLKVTKDKFFEMIVFLVVNNENKSYESTTR